MASFEGPAPLGGELLGTPSPMTSPTVPEVPKLTPERAQQELSRLTAIIKDNPSLHFLEPRVVKCLEDGTQDSATFLSFYRLISQSLSEELVHQKERLAALEDQVIKSRQVSAQAQMDSALAEASQAVNRVTSASAPSNTSAHTEAPASQASSGERTPQVDELLKRLDQAEVQRERLLQDMQNMRNRSKIDIEVKVFKAIEKFALSMLPALDAFHQAMPSLKTATDAASIVTGIEMIHDQLQEALGNAGLSRMTVIGTVFDPRIHESIGDVETNAMPDEHVYDELQPGYLFGERLIRAATVRLARNSAQAPPVAEAPPAPTPAATTPPVAEAPPAPTPAAAAPPVAEAPPAPTPAAATPPVAEAPPAPTPAAATPPVAEAPPAPTPAAATPPVAETPPAPEPAAAPAAATPPVAEAPPAATAPPVAETPPAPEPAAAPPSTETVEPGPEPSAEGTPPAAPSTPGEPAERSIEESPPAKPKAEPEESQSGEAESAPSGLEKTES